MSCAIIFEAGNVLKIWLGNYPQYSVEFCILTLLAIYFEAVSAPLWMTVYAQKDIKAYQIVISLVYSLNFFVGWVVLFLGAAPYSVITVRIFVFIALAGIRLFYTKKYFDQFNTKKWLVDVVLKSLLILLVSSIFTGVIMLFIECHKFIHIVLTTLISLCFTLPMIYF